MEPLVRNGWYAGKSPYQNWRTNAQEQRVLPSGWGCLAGEDTEGEILAGEILKGLTTTTCLRVLLWKRNNFKMPVSKQTCPGKMLCNKQ
ncbi:hypothetical protein Pla22_45570 [Rubripirellula amarantea]|uniref:Uncharacterized protein n=1 Tax=Rubripirellula amarantea TaxID=2527999 RepID=A0A5C5WGX4_9BACT|nr:hypothetical protein Pla22_45570 [Rubripirellula amarantea]